MPEADCLFCRIVADEVPADFVHVDDRAVVIRDLNPQAPTHLLVIPRDHLESLDDASQRDEALLGHLLRVAARVANGASPWRRATRASSQWPCTDECQS